MSENIPILFYYAGILVPAALVGILASLLKIGMALERIADLLSESERYKRDKEMR